MDDRSFDNLVRDLSASILSRRSLALALAGLTLSLLEPLAPDSEAARPRQGRRRKTRKSGDARQGASGGKGGKKPSGGHQGDCDDCPRDPYTGQVGYLCSDGQCSCGGTCCEKGYACFVETGTPDREVCCFIDGNNSDLPDDAKLVSCPGPLFSPETCCDLNLCNADGTCSGLTLGRYRRNPR